jgi:hypothetical protein
LQLQSELLFQSFRESRHSRIKLSVCAGGRRIVALRHFLGSCVSMLGSLSEADHAVQEVWLRLSQSDHSSVEKIWRIADHSRRLSLPWHVAFAEDPPGGISGTPISQIKTHLADWLDPAAIRRVNRMALPTISSQCSQRCRGDAHEFRPRGIRAHRRRWRGRRTHRGASSQAKAGTQSHV